MWQVSLKNIWVTRWIIKTKKKERARQFPDGRCYRAIWQVARVPRQLPKSVGITLTMMRTKWRKFLDFIQFESLRKKVRMRTCLMLGTQTSGQSEKCSRDLSRAQSRDREIYLAFASQCHYVRVFTTPREREWETPRPFIWCYSFVNVNVNERTNNNGRSVRQMRTKTRTLLPL